jgi:hypothetical protein
LAHPLLRNPEYLGDLSNSKELRKLGRVDPSL